MNMRWVVLTVILGAIGALALLRVVEKAVTGRLTSAGMQLVIAVVFGWLAVKTLSKARAKSR